jgi:hypothetical protein
MNELKIIIIILLLLYYLFAGAEGFVSDNTIKIIEKNKKLFSPTTPYKNAVYGICGSKKCIDVVDHYKITEMYANDPEDINEYNLKKQLKY